MAESSGRLRHRRRQQQQQQHESRTFQIHRKELLLLLKPQKPSPSTTTASEAASIQQSLARTQTLLQQELHRVSQVVHAIDQDGKLLQETMSDHKSMNIRQAKQALTALERAQQHEQRILMASILFFWMVVAYILWGRIVTRLPLFDTVVALIQRLLHHARSSFQGSTHQEL